MGMPAGSNFHPDVVVEPGKSQNQDRVSSLSSSLTLFWLASSLPLRLYLAANLRAEASKHSNYGKNKPYLGDLHVDRLYNLLPDLLDESSDLTTVRKLLLPHATDKSSNEFILYTSTYTTFVSSTPHPIISTVFKAFTHPSVLSPAFPPKCKPDHLCRYKQFTELLHLFLLIDYRFALGTYIGQREGLEDRPVWMTIVRNKDYWMRYASLFDMLQQIEEQYQNAVRATNRLK